MIEAERETEAASEAAPQGAASGPARAGDGPVPPAKGRGAKLERASSGRDGPERTCIVTRAALHPDEGLRFVLSPEAIVTPDLKRRLPGRGVWVRAQADLVAQAQKRGAFSRAFRTKASAPADLAGLVDALLTRDCLQSLAMANKAGLVIAGFTKAEAAIGTGETIAILNAADGGTGGRRKLVQAFRRLSEGKTPLEVETFQSAELDLALGRTNVIHAALKSGPAAEAFLARWMRLKQYRGETAARGDAQAADDETNGLSPRTRNV